MDKRIRIDSALVLRGLCSSRTEAQELIDKGFVFMDDHVCSKSSKLVDDTTKLEVRGGRKFVSRGGEKLEGCLLDVYGSNEAIHKAVTGALILDVGASTGGFSDCLLSYGAASIDAVDVGTNQLHTQLRNDKRVHVYENQDIRTFTSRKQYNIIVVDTSFISLNDIVEALINHGTRGVTNYYILIKPQFEVGKGNTKKGIVKNEELVKEVLQNIEKTFVTYGLRNTKVYTSHIQGGDGNQEYFLYGEL